MPNDIFGEIESQPPEDFRETSPLPEVLPPTPAPEYGAEICAACHRPYDLREYGQEEDLVRKCRCAGATSTSYKDTTKGGPGLTCLARTHIICPFPVPHYYPNLVRVQRYVEAGQIPNVTPWGTPTVEERPWRGFLDAAVWDRMYKESTPDHRAEH